MERAHHTSSSLKYISIGNFKILHRSYSRYHSLSGVKLHPTALFLWHLTMQPAMLSDVVNACRGGQSLTGGGSTKLPRLNGSRTKTVKWFSTSVIVGAGSICSLDFNAIVLK